MAKDYQNEEEDSRDRVFFVGRPQKHVHQHIGGCPFATTLTAFSNHWDRWIIVALACKRWGCSHCGPVRVAQMACNVERAAPNKFITLTTDKKLWSDGRTAFDAIRRKLPEFSKRIRKIVGSFEYVRVLELHANGMPHWHLLARCDFIQQRELSDIWASLTGSPIVDIRKAAKGNHAARYVMKYMCKVKYVPWTNRRISWTKKFFPPQPKSDKEDWLLEEKVHHKQCPAWVLMDEFANLYAHRIGPYAWLIDQYPKQGVLPGPLPEEHLVSCIESCGVEEG